MKLKTNLFLWLFPAIAIPMAGFVLIAMAQSEKVYLQDINREIFSSLNGIAVALNRRLLIEQDLIRGLSSVPAVREFIPVLEQLETGRLHPEYIEKTESINRFLEIFQSVRTSLNAVRILDSAGNVLVKVRSGKRIPAMLEVLGDLPYIEQEPGDEVFRQALEELNPASPGVIVLPDDYYNGSGFVGDIPVMNTIIPLRHHARIVGYFTVDAPLLQVNQILNVAQRPYNSELFIAEQNLSLPGRDSLMLYDDRTGITLTSGYTETVAQQSRQSSLSRNLFGGGAGIADAPDGSSLIYYHEMMPYPDSLTSWIIGFRINRDAIDAPFFKRDIVVLAGGAIALLVSLLLAQIGALQIAAPVRKLTGNLASYARRREAMPAQIQGPDELREAGEAFNKMVHNLEAAEKQRDSAELAMLRSAKLASLGQMAAGIGHEINNPLGNILSLTKLVERRLQESDEGIRQDVRGIREEAERVSRIVKAILNFGRQSQPVRECIDVRPWVHDTLGLINTVAVERNINVIAEIDGDSVIEGDRDLLQQALINLLLNALQAGPVGSTIKVKVMQSGSELRLTVRDQGPGIAPEVSGNVFDPFFTTKPEGQGSGLGLSISLGIVQHHGGTLEVGNHPDGGVIATIILPAGVDAEPGD